MSSLPNRNSIYKLRDVSDERLNLPIKPVAVLGTFTGDIYHFQLFLINTSEECSIRLDAHPSFTDMADPNAGVVVIDYAPYMVTVATTPPYINTGTFECTVTKAVDANGIFDVIFNRKSRDRYRFSDDGKGCRHWDATILGDLEEAGILEKGTVGRFEAWEIEQGSKLGAAFPMPRVRGEFF